MFTNKLCYELQARSLLWTRFTETRNTVMKLDGNLRRMYSKCPFVSEYEHTNTQLSKCKLKTRAKL